MSARLNSFINLRPKFMNKFPFGTYVLFLVIVTILFFSPNSLDAFNYPKQLILAAGTFTLLIIYLLSGNRIISGDRTSRTFSILIILFSLSIFVVGLFHGITRVQVFFGTFSRANGVLTYVALGTLALLIFAISILQGTKFLEQSLAFLTFGFFLLSLYCTVQWLNLDPINWNNPYTSVIGTFGNPNFASAALAILAIVSLYFCFKKQSVMNRAFFYALQVLAIVLIYQTKSIQGLAVYAIGIQVLLFCYILLRVQNRLTGILLIFFVALVNLGVLLGVFGLGPLGSLIFQYTLQVRMEYWQIATRMILDFPLLGVGNDSYGDFFRLYRSREFVETYSPNLITNNAHNAILQLGSTTGLIVLLLLTWIIAFTLLVGIKGVSNAIISAKLSGGHKFLSGNCQIYFFAAWIAATAQIMISIDQIGVATIWWTLTALIFASSTASNKVLVKENRKNAKKNWMKSMSRHPRKGLPGLLIFLALFIAISVPLSRHVQNDFRLRSALQIAPVQNNMVLEEARGKEIYESAIGLVEIQDYANLAVRNLYSSGPAELGFDLAKEAVLKNSRSSAAFELLAVGNEFYGRLDEAAANYSIALELDPLNYNVRLKFANLEFKRQKLDSALAEVKIILRDGDAEARKQALLIKNQAEGKP